MTLSKLRIPITALSRRPYEGPDRPHLAAKAYGWARRNESILGIKTSRNLKVNNNIIYATGASKGLKNVLKAQ
jgi:hypothetical protein